MTKVRVYELGKELGMESKDVIRRLGKMGAEVKNHMSTIEDKHADMLRDIVRPKIALEEQKNGEKQEKAEKTKVNPVVEHEVTAVNEQKKHEVKADAKAESQSDVKTEVKSEVKPVQEEKITPVIAKEKDAEPQKEKVQENLAEKSPNEDKAVVKSAETPKVETAVKGAATSEVKPAQKVKISTEIPETTQPRQQGVFKKNENQARQQGVFAKNNNQARQQGTFQKGNNQGGQGGYQNRQGQGGYQNRPAQGTQGQGGYQNRPAQGTQGQGGYQNRPAQGNQGQGGYQNRQGQGTQGQGGYQNRQGQGTQGQGGYQNRQGQGTQGQGGYQNRQGQGTQGQGGYQNRQGQGTQGQGGYQNRQGQGTQGQGGYQNRQGQGTQGQGGYQNRQGQGTQGQGGYQNRQGQGNSGGQGGFQNRSGQGTSGGQGGFQNRDRAAQPSTDTIRPQEKKEPRRFEQKKKNNPYENRKKDFEKRNFGNNRYRTNPKQKKHKKEDMPPVVPKTVLIGETVVISDLAKSMSKTAAELIKSLFNLGVMATVNQEIDSDTAMILGEEFGITVEIKVDKTMEIMEEDHDDESTLQERPPVVTVMGHVDHGKTSLLDAIRNTNVISREAGGITQHIGAYQVEISGKKITFLDTPGHEAFTSMRARGAQVTDIAILVVAADDGVMPQTVEAINHAKAAKVPIIVAINKIDKPGANVDKIRQELTEYELLDEEWGGNTIMVPVSAKKEEGIANLLEMILLVSEVAELKSNPDRNARGTVIEAELDKGRGAVATVLVQKGTLHVGDILVAGTEFAKIRAMIDDKGRRTKVAGPSTPVEVQGFSSVPPAGEVFVCVDDEKDARYIADHNSQVKREKDMGKSAMVTLDDLFKQISEGEIKELNIVLKADVHGSVEALSQSIKNLSTDEVRVNIIHSGVGAIVETDVMLAQASSAIIIGFNVRPDVNTKKAAEKAGVDIRMYRVIYEALDSIKAAMTGLLDPEFKENVVGHVEVRDLIKVPKIGLVAGSYVLDGKVVRNGKVRLLRNGVVIHEGEIASLRRFKDDVKEVQTGFECGICIENFNDVKVEDQMEIYIMEETKRELE